MNDIAFFFGDKFVYWHGIVMALSIVSMILCAAGLRLMQKGDMKGFVLSAAAALPVSLLFSRLFYGFFTLENTGEVFSVLLSGKGGNSLLGAGVGTVLVVVLSKRLGWTDSIADMLDCMAPAAAMALSVGRISARFDNSDRGMEIPGEYVDGYITCAGDMSDKQVLAVFAYESIFAGMLFAGTLLLFLYRWKSSRGKMTVQAGDVALMFLAGFGASQGIMESMRTDSITVSGLGFVRVLQITALICLIVPAVVFGIRAVRHNGISLLQIALWIAGAGFLALAIYMEFTMAADYSVQLANYSAMANCMIGMQVIIVCLYVSQLGSTDGTEKEKSMPVSDSLQSRSLWDN